MANFTSTSTVGCCSLFPLSKLQLKYNGLCPQAAVTIFSNSYMLLFLITVQSCRVSLRKIQPENWTVSKYHLQNQSSSGSVGKSIWPEFTGPRFKSWLDLNVFHCHHSIPQVKYTFNVQFVFTVIQEASENGVAKKKGFGSIHVSGHDVG